MDREHDGDRSAGLKISQIYSPLQMKSTAQLRHPLSYMANCSGSMSADFLGQIRAAGMATEGKNTLNLPSSLPILSKTSEPFDA